MQHTKPESRKGRPLVAPRFNVGAMTDAMNRKSPGNGRYFVSIATADFAEFDTDNK